MQDLIPEAGRRVEEIAGRHGVSRDAALTLLRALAAGGGTMAQFNHPELGGMGQWSAGGMVMVGDMFNHGLKGRVDALCTDLAALLREAQPFATAAAGSSQSQSQGPGGGGMGASVPSGTWWPAELGPPASSGSQNDMRYAYFPASRRLAVQQGGRLSLYDTGDHRIFGVSQQQGPGQSLIFSSDRGTVRLEDLRPVEDAGAGRGSPPPPATHTAPSGAPSPAAAPPPPAAAPGGDGGGGDPLATIERLAELHRKGVLTEEEFTAKKAELLRRL